MVIVTDSRQPGMLHVEDVIQAGESRHHKELMDLQSKMSFDEPINIQFTSVTFSIAPFPLTHIVLLLVASWCNIDSGQVVLLVYLFQGTTGNPKGATLSHHNIVNNAYFLGLRMGYGLRVSPYLSLEWKKTNSKIKVILFFHIPVSLRCECVCVYPCTTALAL